MIHIYPILAIALTAFIRYISDKNFFIKFTFALACIFFIALNISYSMQEADGILNSQYSNFYYNYETLFRSHITYNDLVVFDCAQLQPDENKISKIATLGVANYNDSVSNRYVHSKEDPSGFVYHMMQEEYLLAVPISVIYNKEKFKNGKWLKASGMFMCPADYMVYNKHLLVVEIKHDDKTIEYRQCTIEGKIGVNDSSKNLKLDHYELNKWGKVHFFVKIPDNIKDGDKINVFIWNFGRMEIYIDDLRLELYD